MKVIIYLSIDCYGVNHTTRSNTYKCLRYRVSDVEEGGAEGRCSPQYSGTVSPVSGVPRQVYQAGNYAVTPATTAGAWRLSDVQLSLKHMLRNTDFSLPGMRRNAFLGILVNRN